MKFWSLDRLLVEKYKFSETDAFELSEFLCPLLDFAPEKRPTAQQCLQHPWLVLRDSIHNVASNDSRVHKLEAGVSKLKIKVGK